MGDAFSKFLRILGETTQQARHGVKSTLNLC